MERIFRYVPFFIKKCLTTCPYRYIIIVRTRKEVKTMSPRIKSDNSKHHRFEIRLDDEMNNILEECSERLNITRTDVVNKGIKMVKEDLDKKKE